MSRAAAIPRRNAQIIALYKQGYVSSYVAERLGLTTSTVATVVNRAGIARRKWGKNPNRKHVHSGETHRAVVADYYSGMTYRQVAAKHNLSPKQCWRLVNEVAL